MYRLVCLSILMLVQAVHATEIVYAPNHPAFGGNPLNGPVLLNEANAQNKFTDPSISSALSRFGSQSSQLDLFNQRLQSLILDRLANSLTSGLFDSSGNLKPGTVDTNTFTITIVDLGGGVLQITTTDKTTGSTTTFQVSTAP